VARLGEISPFGRYVLALGAFFSEKYRPKFILISTKFELHFVLKLSHFDKKFLWAKVLHFGRYLDKIGRFFHKASDHTDLGLQIERNDSSKMVTDE
jgi:hypothetical protein